MKLLNRPEFIDETRKVMEIALAHGVVLDLAEAEELWQDISDDYNAQWLTVSSYPDTEIWEMIKKEINNSEPKIQ